MPKPRLFSFTVLFVFVVHRCYECGEFGHLSFHCPKNMLGDRAQPEKKKRKRKKSEVDGEPSGSGATAMEPESDGEEEDDWSLGQAIR